MAGPGRVGGCRSPVSFHSVVVPTRRRAPPGSIPWRKLGQLPGRLSLALGAVKALAILLAGPLLLYPKRGLKAYSVAVKAAYAHTGSFLRWSLGRTSHGEEGSVERPPAAKKSVGTSEKEAATPSRRASKGSAWQLPPLDLLSQGTPAPVPQNVLNKMAAHIEETLADHRVDVKVADIRTGPRVIRFGLVPGWMKRQGDAQKGRAASPSTQLGAEASRVRVQSILAREKIWPSRLRPPTCEWKPPCLGRRW